MADLRAHAEAVMAVARDLPADEPRNLVIDARQLLALYARLDAAEARGQALEAKLREYVIERHVYAGHGPNPLAECVNPICIADRALLEGRDG